MAGLARRESRLDEHPVVAMFLAVDLPLRVEPGDDVVAIMGYQQPDGVGLGRREFAAQR